MDLNLPMFLTLSKSAWGSLLAECCWLSEPERSRDVLLNDLVLELSCLVLERGPLKVSFWIF